MATACNNTGQDHECPSCRADKEARYICLLSEAAFLSSLLRKGAAPNGRKNLLGFAPADLVDWYLYAKRTFAARRSGEAFPWGLKLLDELAKLLFGVGQVTARENGSLLLLSAAEAPLVAAFFDDWTTGGNAYGAEVGKAKHRLRAAHHEFFGRNYPKELEIRLGMTELWDPKREGAAGEARDLLSFRWESRGDVDICLLYWSGKQERPLDQQEISRRRLAKAYLHGVARFALADAEPPRSEPFGYWIDDVETTAAEPGVAALHATSRPGAAPRPQAFCQVPRPENADLRLACESAASYLEEYLDAGFFIGTEADIEPGLFDVLFMCKSKDGWFWAFSKAQFDFLSQNWILEGRSSMKLHAAFEAFRFKTAGFIKLLERTRNLIVELDDFREEKFICLQAGYKFEAPHAAEDFAHAESLIPGINAASSFYYFRISSSDQGGAEEDLREGALVAVVRFPREGLNSSERAQLMGRMRAWVERWRAKDHSLKRTRKVVHEIERPHQRRTARAAIMSRNLSHNIGSHALASSRFYDAVGVLQLETKPPKESEKDLQAQFSPRPSRPATFITRGEVWRARTRLGALNSYLQGRMDFIARALGESTSQPEPMFFVNDLLDGFLSQTVLLSTLLSDNGFTCEKMEFRVSLPGVAKPLIFDGLPGADRELRHAAFRLREGGVSQDLLIAVPGGMVGRHAFYALLENLMRNATKYGANARRVAQAAGKKFIIHLRLQERKLPVLGSENGWSPCYELTLTESLSRDCPIDPEPAGESAGARTRQGGVARRIRRYLTEDIIGQGGQPRTEGHGIQEMKVCAQFLAGGDQRTLIYPGDDEVQRGTKGKDPAQADDPYREYIIRNEGELKAASGKHAWIGAEVASSLRCCDLFCDDDGAPTSETAGRPHLAYSLILLRPTLLGLARWPDEAWMKNVATEPAATEASVAFYDGIEALSESPAYFGVIVVDGPPSAILIESIAARHTRLPFRLMIAAGSQELAEAWKHMIAAWQAKQAEGWWSRYSRTDRPFPLPPERLKVICCPELWQQAMAPDSVRAGDWRRTVCELYELWLMAFKGHELEKAYAGKPHGPWHLYVGFDRDAQAIETKWYPNGTGDERASCAPKCVQLHLYARGAALANGAAPAVQVGPKDAAEIEPPPVGACLVLDNHGQVISSLGATTFASGAPAARHPFSGAEQVTLFEMLANPPADPYSRAFFICSIVEALLTWVFVVDERVAEATVEKDSHGRDTVLRSKSFRLQQARIIPLYHIQTEVPAGGADLGSAGLTCQLSVRIDDAMQREPEATIAKTEGLALAPQSQAPDHVALRPAVVREQPWRAELMPPADFTADCIVIHEGVVDSVNDARGWPAGLHRQLHAICPWVVRTSGRGAASRHLGSELPFLEFSELSDTTYRQMNKVSLVRGLLSLRGARLP